jgi:hypothetical protein
MGAFNLCHAALGDMVGAFLMKYPLSKEQFL